ncbi:unnamed protein product [Rotaria magnacalcarata]
MGDILVKQIKHIEAMDYYQQALKIRQILYPDGHDLTAISLHDMGATKFDQAEFGLSLYYYEQTLKQKNPKKALQYHQQALNIYEKSLPNDGGLRQEIVNSIHRLSIVK